MECKEKYSQLLQRQQYRETSQGIKELRGILANQIESFINRTQTTLSGIHSKGFTFWDIYFFYLIKHVGENAEQNWNDVENEISSFVLANNNLSHISINSILANNYESIKKTIPNFLKALPSEYINDIFHSLSPVAR